MLALLSTSCVTLGKRRPPPCPRPLYTAGRRVSPHQRIHEGARCAQAGECAHLPGVAVQGHPRP